MDISESLYVQAAIEKAISNGCGCSKKLGLIAEAARREYRAWYGRDRGEGKGEAEER